MTTPPRETLLRPLRRALGISTTSTPLYLHGAPSTGRLTTLLQATPPTIQTITIDCILKSPDRIFLSAISPGPSDLPSFLTRLSSLPPTLLILLRSERLSHPPFTQSLLPLLFSLPILSKNPTLRLALISRSPFPALQRNLLLPLPHPQTFSFPPYTRLETLTHLTSTSTPSEAPFHKPFATMLLDALIPTTNHLPDAIALHATLLPHYISAQHSSTPLRAFRAIQPALQRALRAQHRRNSIPTATLIATELHSRTRESRLAEWGLGPVQAKLLVAAFLVAANPSQHDTRYFSATRVRVSKKRKRMPPKPSRKAPTTRGRPFSLERLLAVHRAIADDGAMRTCVLRAVPTLVALRYLTRESSDALEPRFRCEMGLAAAERLAGLVDIELWQYVHHEG